MDPVSFIVSKQKEGQFLLKIGHNLNSVASQFSLSISELLERIFDHVLMTLEHVDGKITMAVKNRDPRVTLLSTHKSTGEDFTTFKQNFTARVICYLCAENCRKDFYVILTVENK